MKPAERAALDAAAAKLTLAIRDGMIEPAEVILATVERIRVQTYDDPDTTAHAIEQLRELAGAVKWKLKTDVRAIERLRDGLAGFERQLNGMNHRRV